MEYCLRGEVERICDDRQYWVQKKRDCFATKFNEFFFDNYEMEEMDGSHVIGRD